MKKIEGLKPFTRFLMTIGELPSSYLVSMTYEEQLIWFCNYLQNTVIPAINNNGKAVEELQNKFIELKDYVDNYFENLDIQTEVDNKLDEMSESGELADLISQYLELSSVLAFDTKADLKGGDNFIAGSIARTLGSTTYNDGNGHYYRIRNYTTGDVIDDENILELTNYPTLVAELINENVEIIYNTLDDLKNDSTLFAGKQVITLGYNTVNDGGAGKYLIRELDVSDTIDEGSIVEINEDLVAELIIDDVILEQFGAVGDGTTDDTEAIQNAITYAKANNKLLTCNTRKIFAVSEQLDVSDLYIDLKYSTLKALDDITSILVVNSNNKNYSIKNIKLDCDNLAFTGLLITNAKTYNITEVKCYNFVNYGIKVDAGYEVIMNEIFMYTPSNTAIGIELNTTDCILNNIIMTDVTVAFRLTKGSNTFNNIHCWISSSSKINDSIMFKLALAYEGSLHLNQIYNDTFRYGFYYENNTTCYLYVDNFETQYNKTIYTSDKESSYIIYANTDNQTYYSNIDNGLIIGLSSNSEIQHTEMTNRDYYYGNISHSNLSNIMSKSVFGLTSVDNRFNIVENHIYKHDGVITINFLASYNSSSVSGMINPIGNLSWFLGPINRILTDAQVTDSLWDWTTVTSHVYCFIDRDGGKIQVKLPTGQSGTKYLHINITYLSDQYR